eukprot:scaffold12057_cov133-Isochrysis_galbana.AAC.5
MEQAACRAIRRPRGGRALSGLQFELALLPLRAHIDEQRQSARCSKRILLLSVAAHPGEHAAEHRAMATVVLVLAQGPHDNVVRATPV